MELLCTERVVKSAHRELWDRVKKTVTVQRDEDGAFDLDIADPCKLLPLMSSETPTFADIYYKAREFKTVIIFDRLIFLPKKETEKTDQEK